MARNEIERVYLVGAGFSAGAGYPLGNRLVPEIIHRLKGAPPRNPVFRGKFENSLRMSRKNRTLARYALATIQAFLEMYFGITLNLQKARPSQIDAALAKISVAEFYTLAQAFAERELFFASGPAGRRRRQKQHSALPGLYEILAAAVRTYFNDISTVVNTPKDVSAILETISASKHAMIDFNWDEEVDIYLSDKYDVSYTFGDWQSNTRNYLLLKPHGSINWYDIKQGIGNRDLYFIADRDNRLEPEQRRLVAYEANSQPEDLDGGAYSVLSCPPIITPPTFAKRFDYLEQQLIWRDTLRVCTTASQFVFLGYALPPDDFLTRAAIRRSLHARKPTVNMQCLIVSRYLDDIANYQELFGGALTAQNHFNWTFGGGSSAAIGELFGRKLKQASVA